MALWYEDFEVGSVVTTPARTVLEADIAMFAGLSGDYNPIHTDDEFAKQTEFGQRVAHGLLGLAIASGFLRAPDCSMERSSPSSAWTSGGSSSRSRSATP